MIKASHGVMVLGLCLSLGAGACGKLSPGATDGSGVVKTETRAATGFTAVDIAGAAQVTIEQTGSESVTVESDDNLLPLIRTDVAGGKLVVDLKPGTSIGRSTKLHVKITAKQIDEISLSGAGSVKATGLKGEKLSVIGSGAGRIEAEGSVTEQSVRLSGVGVYDAAKLVSDKVQVKLSGVGGATVNATTTLDATVSGAGSIAYVGSPTVTKKISGLGSVEPKR